MGRNHNFVEYGRGFLNGTNNHTRSNGSICIDCGNKAPFSLYIERFCPLTRQQEGSPLFIHCCQGPLNSVVDGTHQSRAETLGQGTLMTKYRLPNGHSCNILINLNGGRASFQADNLTNKLGIANTHHVIQTTSIQSRSIDDRTRDTSNLALNHTETPSPNKALIISSL